MKNMFILQSQQSNHYGQIPEGAAESFGLMTVGSAIKLASGVPGGPINLQM